MYLIKNGDIFDLGQTVNGVSRFLYLNGKWYYFEERLSHEYEYSQEDLTKQVRENEFEEIKWQGNIFRMYTEPEAEVLAESVAHAMVGFVISYAESGVLTKPDTGAEFDKQFEIHKRK